MRSLATALLLLATSCEAPKPASPPPAPTPGEGCDQRARARSIAADAEARAKVDLEGAIALLRRAIAEAPDEPSLHLRLGQLEARREAHGAAADAYARAAALAPGHPAPLEGEASSRLARARADGAQAVYRDAQDVATRCLAVAPSSCACHEALGHATRQLGDDASAARSLAAAVACDPSRSLAWLSLVELHIAAHDRAGALQVTARALAALGPSHEDAWKLHVQAASVSSALGDRPAALRSLEAAASLTEHPSVLFALGSALVRGEAGERPRGVELLTRFTKVACKGVHAQRFAAECESAASLLFAQGSP